MRFKIKKFFVFWGCFCGIFLVSSKDVSALSTDSCQNENYQPFLVNASAGLGLELLLDNENGVKLFWKTADDRNFDIRNDRSGNDNSRLFCGINENDSQSCPKCNLGINQGARFICCVLKDKTANPSLPVYTVLNLDSEEKRCCCYGKDKSSENCAWFDENCPDGSEMIVSDTEAATKCANTAETVLQIPIPNVGGGSVRLIESYGQYVNTIFKWMIAMASILAVLVIIISGFQWILAAGNSGKISKAKEKIKNSLMAIFFISASYLILAVINPKLLNLSILIPKVPAIGLDIKKATSGTGNCSQMIGDAESASTNVNVTTYDGLLRQAASENNIDCDYLKAIMIAESHGDPNASSDKEACGLMQVLPSTAGKTCEELKDPATGIAAGAKYAAQLLATAGGDFNLLAAAYNGGPGALLASSNCPGLQKWQCLYDNDAHTLANEGYEETRTYVQRTQGYLNMIVENNLTCNADGVARATSCTTGGNGASAQTPSSFEIVTQSEGESWLQNEGITVYSSGSCSDRSKNVCTSLEGMRRDTISEIVRLKRACGNSCVVVVTAGTETGHATGDFSHSRGYKVDLKLTSTLTNFIKANYPQAGTRGGRNAAQLYAGSEGVIYALEDDHWDVLVP